MNKSGIQAQLADAAFGTMVEATVPWCLKILDGARDLPLANAWANRRRSLGGGVLMLRTVTPDTVQIADLPALTARTLADFAGWQALATDGIVVILEVPINEKFHTDMDEFAALAEASDHFVEAATDAGFWAGVLITSEGNPPGDAFGSAYFTQPRVLTLLRKWRRLPLRKPGKRVIWCPHGYSHPPTEADDPWHFDRPRRILDRLPEDARLNYALGEIGCDGGCDLPDKKPGVGWQGYFDPDEGRIKRYAGWVRPQVQAIANDPLCIAGAVFLSGADPNGRPNFVSFDVKDEVDFRPVLTEPVPGPPITWLEPIQEAPVPDVDFGVPTITALTEAHGPPRTTTVGIFVHATRSGSATNTLQQEYLGTVNYFLNPDGDSSHVVVGPSEVARMVHDADQSYHAQENNRTHLSIEIAQPKVDTPYTSRQYELAAAVARAWCAKYQIPRVRVMSQAIRGIIGHEDSEQGKRYGKSDPGPQFDWPRFINLVKGGNPVPDTEKQLEDLVWGLGDQLQKIGPRYDALGDPHRAAYCKTQGEALKEFVNTALKGQK